MSPFGFFLIPGPELDPVVLVLGVLLACCVTVIVVLTFYVREVRRRACEHCKGTFLKCTAVVVVFAERQGIAPLPTTTTTSPSATKAPSSAGVTHPALSLSEVSGGTVDSPCK